ncbi:ATP12 family chaperone protein [Litorimonas sp. RW-G-Af-16]|uniref:ATP12 family chaperone protein n=1 Tax=Litorimonas sp. RW-G-Af-16 TaxID=3241168 RepID=UPI00390CAE96
MAKRFYKDVTVEAGESGYVVLLDGRQLKTPGKKSLNLPTQGLAQLIAAEWDAQVDEINPAIMPITRLANVALERTPDHRDDIVLEARNYAGTDLLCYRAPDPADLTQRQITQWGPWLEWAKARGVDLTAVTGIVAVEQAEGSLDAVADYARNLSDIDLTLFVHFTAVFGSAILGMAVMEGALSAEDAFELSRLDEAYQIEAWGVDDEAKIRTDNIRAELLALAEILNVRET